jgi:hypothetical protein
VRLLLAILIVITTLTVFNSSDLLEDNMAYTVFEPIRVQQRDMSPESECTLALHGH